MGSASRGFEWGVERGLTVTGHSLLVVGLTQEWFRGIPRPVYSVRGFALGDIWIFDQ